MDVNRLSQGEKIAGIAGILLFISMFFAWFGFDTGLDQLQRQLGVNVGSTSISFNAWESFDFIDTILLVTVIAAVAAAAMRASDAAIDLPLNTGVAVLGGLSTVLILYRIIDPPGSADREWGVFLGLILAGILTYGAYRAMQEEGITFSDAADRLSAGRGQGLGGTQSPLPPSPPPPTPPGGQQPPPQAPGSGQQPPAPGSGHEPPPPPGPGA